MIKTKLFKIFCVALAAGTICIIPVNIMEASKTPVVKNTSTVKVTGNNTLSIKKKENGIIVDTSLSADDQKKLFKQYKEYEIENKDGILYYNKKPVRCFADIYGVVSYNENGGKTINSKSIYSYFNENGKADVCIERENIKSGEKWSFGKIINWSLALEDMAFAMPEKVINQLLAENIKKGNYNDLEILIVFADKDGIDNAANQIIAKGDYKILENIAWSIAPSTLGRIALQLIEKSQYDVLTNIVVFLEKKDLEEVAETLCNKKEYDVFSGISWAFDKRVVYKYANQFVENKQYEELQNIIYFVDKEDTDQIARKLYEQGNYAEIGNIAWNVSREVLEELAKLMTDKSEYNGLMFIVPYLAK